MKLHHKEEAIKLLNLLNLWISRCITSSLFGSYFKCTSLAIKSFFSGQGLLRRTTHYSFPHPHVRNKSNLFLDKTFIFDCTNIQYCCFPWWGWHGNHSIVILTNDSIFGRSTYKECRFDATGDPSILLINWQPQSMNWKSLPIIIYINPETFVLGLNLLFIFY